MKYRGSDLHRLRNILRMSLPRPGCPSKRWEVNELRCGRLTHLAQTPVDLCLPSSSIHLFRGDFAGSKVVGAGEEPVETLATHEDIANEVVLHRGRGQAAGAGSEFGNARVVGVG